MTWGEEQVEEVMRAYTAYMLAQQLSHVDGVASAWTQQQLQRQVQLHGLLAAALLQLAADCADRRVSPYSSFPLVFNAVAGANEAVMQAQIVAKLALARQQGLPPQHEHKPHQQASRSSSTGGDGGGGRGGGWGSISSLSLAVFDGSEQVAHAMAHVSQDCLPLACHLLQLLLDAWQHGAAADACSGSGGGSGSCSGGNTAGAAASSADRE
jgi:hypothetical protein